MSTQVAVNMNVKESLALGRGRQSLDRSVWYSGWLMTFLATAEDTHGQFALIEAVARKGNVPPPHIHHREEETFYVLEGEMTVLVGNRTIKATPGTTVIVPRDVVHSFAIESQQLRVLILITPAGMEGWFKEFSVPAPSMTLPPAVEVSVQRDTKNARGRPAIRHRVYLAKDIVNGINDGRMRRNEFRYLPGK